MYMVATSQYEKSQWMKAFWQGEGIHLMDREHVPCNHHKHFLTVVQRKGVHMFPLYHPGFHNQKQWTCCKEANPKEEGCTATGSPPAAYEGN